MTPIPPPGSDFLPHFPGEAPRSGSAPNAGPAPRSGGLSWRRLGGDGLIVSLGLHGLALALAFALVVRTTSPTRPPAPDNSVFLPGKPGGDHGERPSDKAAKPDIKRHPVGSVTSRIVTRNATSSVALAPVAPDNPAGFGTRMAAGDLSKGVGGGPSLPGTIPGAKHFVGIPGFGRIGAPGLPGVFFDAKQRPDGAESKYAAGDASEAFVHEVLRPFVRSWDPAKLEGRFFRAPAELAVSRIFIPHQGADAAPEAFEVAGRVKASRWLAWYRGVVTAPATGRFRFWGLGDDALVVRWDRKLALDAGWTILSAGSGGANFQAFAGKAVLGVTETRQGAPGALFRAGPWIRVEKGREYPVELLLSEIPGGRFGAWLLMEEADPATPFRGDGKLFLFRMTDEPLPDGLKQDTGLEIDMTGKSLVWKARATKSASTR